MEIPRPLRLIYLEWEDAASRASWMDTTEIEDYAAGQFLVRQAGYLLEDTDRYLLLAGSWGPEGEWQSERFGDITRIPRTWIRHRRTLAIVTEEGRIRVQSRT